MTLKSRRDFLRAAAQAAGSATAMGVLPAGIRNALAIPAHNAKGSIEDVEHIVILMQETRSFDHYFGTLRGVRGFGDRRALTLPGGQPVWYQPTAPGSASSVLPFHPAAQSPGQSLGLTFLQDLPHDWTSTHAALNGGLNNQWVPSKGSTSMAYLTREDIPFHYQLADAFTICDAYHCSILGATDPNRYYLWTGWVGNDGSGGGPVIDNSEAGYGWSTYPEVLQAAGISWKIYQDIGTGLDAAGSWGWTQNPYIGNYGDTSLLYFHQYQNAQPGTPLYDNARTGTNVAAGEGYFDILKRDVANGTLPQVSWVVAPEAYSEHPNWPSNYGAWYVDQVLQILTSNPEVWSKTVFLINFDENDGFFDHVVPPFPSTPATPGLSTVDTAGEYYTTGTGEYPAGKYASGEYGLGPRVPMLVVSPWSRGGWVCSEVFDHTSVIRFIERRFGARGNLGESNITPWRRAVCGDLMSAFNFVNPNDSLPTMPSTTGYVPPDQNRHPDYVPSVPQTQARPKQEPGLRPARAVPYELFVRAKADGAQGVLTMRFVNTGRRGAVFLVYAADGSAPRTYTVEAGRRLEDRLPLDTNNAYDYTVYGPNGYLRRFAGKEPHDGAGSLWTHNGVARPDVVDGYDVANGNLQLTLENLGSARCEFRIVNAYEPDHAVTQTVIGGRTQNVYLDLRNAYGWYDLTVTVNTDANFVRRLGGHVETGRPGFSDPALGG